MDQGELHGHGQQCGVVLGEEEVRGHPHGEGGGQHQLQPDVVQF